MKNLDETDNFGDQFLNDKPTEDDQEKTNVVDVTDSIIPDLSHQSNTSAPPVTTPVFNISSLKPSSQVNAPPINTEATTIITTIPEITLFIALQLRVVKLEQDMSEVKKTDHSAAVLASIQSQVPTVVKKYIGTKIDDALLKALERHTADLVEKYYVLPAPESSKKQELEKSPKKIIKIKREQGEKKPEPIYTIKSTDKAALEEFDLKGGLFNIMHKNKSANRNPAKYRLYHALMEALIEDENAMDKEVADKVKDHKRKRDSDDDEDDDDEGPSAGSNQGESTKRRRHDSSASGSAQPPSKDYEQKILLLSLQCKRSDHQSEQSSDDNPITDEGHVLDLEDTDNTHIPKVPAATWFKPIPEEERPTIPEPEWTIPSNDYPKPENNWVNIYSTTYQDPEENKLQRKTGDIGSFIKWFCKRTGKKKLCKADLEGPTFNLVKPFHNNSVSLQFQMDECHQLLTDKVDLVNPEGHQILRNVYEPLPLGGPPGDKERKTALSISKLKAARYLDFGLEDLVPYPWVESERYYDISAAYGITHWWFRRKEFYINKHREPSDRDAVRSHMRILSVISIKTYERYGYNYLREIVLRRADYKEYKISEKDFKNLYPNDFEDLFLLHFQDKLNHLPKSDKVNLHTAVNMWIINIVIRKCVEDLQLGVESYQTKLNLEQPNWDASDFLFKEDYTIVNKPRAVIYRDRDDNKKMMRINEVHKFSDGTLMRIRDKLDFMVKDFRLFKFNKGMENRKWTEDDKRRSEDFIEDHLKMEMEMEIPSVKASANSDIVYFFTSAQDGNTLQDDERLDLADDLMKAQVHNQRQAATAGLWLQTWRVCGIASIFTFLFSNVDDLSTLQKVEGWQRERIAHLGNLHRRTLAPYASGLPCGTKQCEPVRDCDMEMYMAMEKPIIIVIRVAYKRALLRLHPDQASHICDVQSAFVSNRQILGGPFILNELLSWCKHKKFKAIVFKVGFKKEFDSIRWDYLQDILKMFGFGDKWCVKVGGAMSIIKSWDDMVAKVSYSLSKWKLKTLSIVLKLLEVIRRNFYNGVDGSERKMAWISWNKVLASKKYGGLGVSIIYSEDDALNFPSSLSKRSPWLDIIREDPWLDDLALKHNFLRLYALDNYKQITVVDKINHASMVDTFRRPPRGGAEEEQVWSLEAMGEFSVKYVRQLIDDLILPKEEVAIRWVKVMPIKINVFAWRVRLDKLPTRLNLSSKGIDISTIICPICHAYVESGSHIFFSYPITRQLWRKLMRWWEFKDIDLASYDDWLIWLNSSRLSKRLKEILEGVCYVKWWLIWLFKNKLFFGTTNPRREFLLMTWFKFLLIGVLIVVILN
ncbi:reverse transcriptase domain-containing protein [Tanacetum coccineum]